tara:strand:+ start:1439 stop:1720 length:282 start_codon:yes stop_codon:yes gene_type:complete
MKINDLKNNLSSFSRPWQFIIFFFMLSIISVFASLLMDQKLYIKQKNNNELEILKASFSIQRKDLIDLKKIIMLNAEKFDFKRHQNIILISYE